jgi:hypothetical protein
MKKATVVLIMGFLLGAASLYAQYPSVTIAQIQEVPLGLDSSTYCGDTIHVCGTIIGGTGLYYAGSGVSFYMEMQEGGPWSGIMAYNVVREGFPSLIPGDAICFDALVDEYNWVDTILSRFTSNMTELWIIPGTFVFESFGNPEPTPISITADVIDSTDGSDSLAEQYEGVYVRVNDVTVDTVIMYTSTSEWLCHDPTGHHLMVREASDSISFLPTAGMTFAYVQGVLYDRFGAYHLQPRYIRDMQLPVGGPIISNVSSNPPFPINNGSGDADSVVVRANVVGPDSITNVWIYYRFNLGNWQSVAMTPSTNYFYTFTFPPLPGGYRVDYYVRARDIDGDTSKFPDQAPISFLGFEFQNPTVMTIAQARADANHDFLPDLASNAVVLTGVASTSNFSTTTTNFFMQSDGAAINVFLSSQLININIGDSIKASGIVGQYTGKTQLQVYKASRITNFGTIGHLDTLQINCSSLADSIGEQNEGLLAVIPSADILDTPDTWPIIGYSATMTIYDYSDSAMLRIESTTDIPGQSRPDTAKQIIGIIGQYDTSPPYKSGYQMQPRRILDFQQAFVPPPTISRIAVYPSPMQPAQQVTLKATIGTPGSITTDSLYFKLGAGSFVPVTHDSIVTNNVYWFKMSSYSLNDSVTYYVVATDNIGQRIQSADGWFKIENACEYLIGDMSGDGQRLGGDVTYGVRFFKGVGSVPKDSCFMDSTGAWLYVAGDVNGNCEYRGSDITRLVAYFKGTAHLSYCHFFPTELPPLLKDFDFESINMPVKNIEQKITLPVKQVESPRPIKLQKK